MYSCSHCGKQINSHACIEGEKLYHEHCYNDYCINLTHKDAIEKAKATNFFKFFKDVIPTNALYNYIKNYSDINTFNLSIPYFVFFKSYRGENEYWYIKTAHSRAELKLLLFEVLFSYVNDPIDSSQAVQCVCYNGKTVSWSYEINWTFTGDTNEQLA